MSRRGWTVPPTAGKGSHVGTGRKYPPGYDPENDSRPLTSTNHDDWTARKSHRHARLFFEYGDFADRRSLATTHLQVDGDLGSYFVASLPQCGVHTERPPRCSGSWRRQRCGKLRGPGWTTGNGRPSE